MLQLLPGFVAQDFPTSDLHYEQSLFFGFMQISLSMSQDISQRKKLQTLPFILAQH